MFTGGTGFWPMAIFPNFSLPRIPKWGNAQAELLVRPGRRGALSGEGGRADGALERLLSEAPPSFRKSDAVGRQLGLVKAMRPAKSELFAFLQPI